jgi:transcriptional regulator with XRE-family HTH domain
MYSVKLGDPVDPVAFGRQLRTLRTAAGRTVASVAVDAGLSVPYLSNLENGRGNPTASVLDRVATALGAHLTLTLNVDGRTVAAEPPAKRALPSSLTRLSRTARFAQVCAALADLAGEQLPDYRLGLVNALDALAGMTGRELNENDWWRLLDALTLVMAHPAG